jgi:hypothetical protein
MAKKQSKKPAPVRPALPAQGFAAPATVAVGTIPEGKIVDFLTGRHVKDKPEGVSGFPSETRCPGRGTGRGIPEGSA